MWQSIIHFFLRLFGRIQNHTKEPELITDVDDEFTEKQQNNAKGAVIVDAIAGEVVKEIDKEVIDDLFKEVVKKNPFSNLSKPKPEPKAPTQLELRWALIEEMLERPFETPLDELPGRRYPKKDNDGNIIKHGVYSIFGRAPKEDGNKQYPKAKCKVYKNLPGDWNNGKVKLYVEENMGIHLKQALQRAQDLEENLSELLKTQYDVLSYITRMGSMSHRHIQHKPENELSYHSWALAADVDPKDNRGIHSSSNGKWLKKWKKNKKTFWGAATPSTATKGPIYNILPFSKQWYEMYPKSMPFELVMCFKAVGFAWGGDWGRSKWHEVVKKFGAGFDQDDPNVSKSGEYLAAMVEWSDMRYTDPMHFELTTRGIWATRHWNGNEEKLKDHSHVV